MGQYWFILNLDKKEIIGTGGKLGEVIFGVGRDLYCALIQPGWIPVTNVMDKLKISYKKDYNPRSLGYFGKLPVEVINTIFHEIDDLKSILYLACTNTRLLILSEKRLRSAMHVPSWGGDRIICLGDYADDDDLPEGVISQEYLDFKNDLSRSDEESDEEEAADWKFVKWAMSNFRRGRKQHAIMEHVREGLKTNDIWKNIDWQRIPKQVRNDSDVIDGLLKHITNVDERVFIPNMEVLWNHTKKVYIRLSTALDELEDTEVTVPDDYKLLGTLLFIHICWSSDPSTSMGYEGDALHHGRWAGDRFEFTEESVLDSRLEKEKGEWKDVSKDALKLYAEVFEGDLGEEWKKELFRWFPEFKDEGFWKRRLRPAYLKAKRQSM